jgi:hypothetical protein
VKPSPIELIGFTSIVFGALCPIFIVKIVLSTVNLFCTISSIEDLGDNKFDDDLSSALDVICIIGFF